MFVAAACTISAWLPAPASAQAPANPESAAVDFGVFPSGPLGPLPCLQSGPIGGPTDPCSYKLHPDAGRIDSSEGRRSDVPDSRWRPRVCDLRGEPRHHA